MPAAAQIRSSWLREAAFTGLCLSVAFVWDVAFGLSYDRFAPSRALGMEISYFAIPMVLCAILGFFLRRWLRYSDTGGALLAATLSVVAAPFLVFLPVLFFDCVVLKACIG